MDVDVPQSGHQGGAVQVDLGSVAVIRFAAVGSDLADAAILDHHRCARKCLRTNAINEGRIGQKGSHWGPHSNSVMRQH